MKKVHDDNCRKRVKIPVDNFTIQEITCFVLCSYQFLFIPFLYKSVWYYDDWNHKEAQLFVYVFAVIAVLLPTDDRNNVTFQRLCIFLTQDISYTISITSYITIQGKYGLQWWRLDIFMTTRLSGNLASLFSLWR